MPICEMGGRIEVRSALGQGATFTVVLNRADGKGGITKKVIAN
jgi:signal transduction histidine kinase